MAAPPSTLRLADFDFDLPADRIALRPASPRDTSRLMVVTPSRAPQDRHVRDLAELLAPADVLVFNDSRVIPARLTGVRDRVVVQPVQHGAENDPSVGTPGRARVEATLHKRLAPDRWAAFLRPGKRVRVGDAIRFGDDEGLGAVVLRKADGGEVELGFDRTGADLDAAVEARGVMPLPPYIAAQRRQDAQDRFDYQTVYARIDGSVAAPTAGLHFTPELLGRLTAIGVGSAFVTLHVGAGTFLPVKTDHIADHRMHAETGEVSPLAAEQLNAARSRGGRIVCVGTTSLRLLESATDATGRVRAFSGETDIFITPGYRFKAADVLMTNFHLPRSTLIMLVAALAGTDTVRAAYAHALEHGYRFYSYGDAGLWFRDTA